MGASGGQASADFSRLGLPEKALAEQQAPAGFRAGEAPIPTFPQQGKEQSGREYKDQEAS